jgi:hypothetical protein
MLKIYASHLDNPINEELDDSWTGLSDRIASILGFVPSLK